MASELLRKEEEYRKINQELEVKSKYLFQEADNARKQQENVYYNKIESLLNSKNDIDLAKDGRTDASYASSNVTGNLQIPPNVNEIGIRGMSHFFRAKIKKLQDDLEQLQNEIKNKNDECKRLIKDNQKLADEKDKWFQISTSNKSHVTKLENQAAALNSKLQNKENENLKLRKEIEDLQKQLKSSTLLNNNNEMKLAKCNEERDKLKEGVKILKQDEKVLREMHKKQIDEMSLIIKRIDKHRNELINGFNKQLQLLDNLKRQKALLENGKVTEKLEADFLRILDWNLDE